MPELKPDNSFNPKSDEYLRAYINECKRFIKLNIGNKNFIDEIQKCIRDINQILRIRAHEKAKANGPEI